MWLFTEVALDPACGGDRKFNQSGKPGPGGQGRAWYARIKLVCLPGSPIKLSDTTAWRWISGQDGGSRSVLYHATRSICWCCTLGESEYRAVQPPRVRSLVLGQGGALPPDTVAGGETRDAA